MVDAIKNGEIQLMFNTTEGAQAMADSFSLRQTALLGNIPYYTTVAGARATVEDLARGMETFCEVVMAAAGQSGGRKGRT